MLGVGDKGQMVPGQVPEGEKGLPKLMKTGEEARLLELKKEREIFLAGSYSTVPFPGFSSATLLTVTAIPVAPVLAAEANSWRLPQSVPSANPAAAPKATGPPYGFLSIHSGLFPSGIHGELNDLGSEGESLSVEDRLKKCVEREEAKFDPGQYQCALTSPTFARALALTTVASSLSRGDFVYDDEIKELIRWQAPWSKEAASAEPLSDESYFTEDEQTALKSLATNDEGALPSVISYHYLEPV